MQGANREISVPGTVLQNARGVEDAPRKSAGTQKTRVPLFDTWDARRFPHFLPGV
jgi:hypothetical protein